MVYQIYARIIDKAFSVTRGFKFFKFFLFKIFKIKDKASAIVVLRDIIKKAIFFRRDYRGYFEF